MTGQHHPERYQCGAVSYEVNVDNVDAITCNCSRSKPMGFVLAFLPRDNFELKSGEHDLIEYRFNKKEIQHLFCRTCGVESFANDEQADSKLAAINVNCLEGVDPRALEPQQADGASF